MLKLKMLIQKLEKRFYPREEIAKIMNLSSKDNNFAAKVKTRLNNWKYEYNYSRKGVEIIKQPSTVEEKLTELLIRKLDLDIQTYIQAFAIMMYLLATDFDFASSPWETKSTIIYKEYGIYVADSTMRNWAKRLIREDILQKNIDEHELWRSYRDELSIKHQERVSDNEEKIAEYEKYKQKRSQYLKEADEAYHQEHNTIFPSPSRWKETFGRLWNEFHCCYYTVKPFVFNAFYDDDYREIFSLTEDLIHNLVIEVTDKKGTVEKAGFVF